PDLFRDERAALEEIFELLAEARPGEAGDHEIVDHQAALQPPADDELVAADDGLAAHGTDAEDDAGGRDREEILAPVGIEKRQAARAHALAVERWAPRHQGVDELRHPQRHPREL